MEIRNTNICIASAYAAEYAGNFILMLKALAHQLKTRFNSKIYFIFPLQPHTEWLKELESEYEVAFTRLPYNYSVDELYHILEKWNINLVHSHFERYDIPLAKAIRKTKRDIKQVWHLHDHVEVDKSYKSMVWLRKRKANWLYWKHYGYWGKNAYLVGVSTEVLYSIEEFKKSPFNYPRMLSNQELSEVKFNSGEVVINGIVTDRLNKQSHHFDSNKPRRFLTFGGEVYRKGIPTLLDAGEILSTERNDFEIIITRGREMQGYLKERYGSNFPKWLTVVPQTQDIASLFKESFCYVSAALRETMSMAIAEASIFGLPIIQSDIPGTWWNADTPSAFIFKVNDSANLAMRMQEVLDTDSLVLEESCKISSEINTPRLSIDKWCDAITAIYQKV